MRIRRENPDYLTDQPRDPKRPGRAEDLPNYDRVLINPELHNPPGAIVLAEVREHIMARPEGILLDVYQGVTSLELKHPPGSLEGQERYLDGLRDEIDELHVELSKAFMENPLLEVGDLIEGPEDSWLMGALDPRRLRFQYLDAGRKEKFLGELGDVLWYTSRLASEHGTTLSSALVEFIRRGRQAPKNLEEAVKLGMLEQVEARAAEILDAELIQNLALSQKMAFYGWMNEGMPIQQKRTIDSDPQFILDHIKDELYPEGRPDKWEAESPYTQLPDLKQTIGKLVWFTAYTSHTILNAEFSTVMQANLQKITQRSRRGTIFSKQDRTEADESGIHASEHRRMPLE